METLPEGYPKLAALQGIYPQLGIYRRFATLNARNLLYLQAELVILESDLNKFTLKDYVSEDLTAKLYHKNWHRLNKRKDGVLNSQYYTMLRVREKLKEYSKAPPNGANVGLLLMCTQMSVFFNNVNSPPSICQNPETSNF
jgi:hypothetical protein